MKTVKQSITGEAPGNKVYSIITEKIMEKLEQGVIPWRKPWASAGPPTNLISGNAYRGINTLLLMLSPYKSPYWLTFNQIQDLKASIRKGEQSSMVIFYKSLTPKDEDGEDSEEKKGKIPFLRYYRVFNTDQCENLHHKRLDALAQINDQIQFDPIEEAERVIQEMTDRPMIEGDGNRACYRPTTDTITMPCANAFQSSEEYYSTLFHELGHATGHQKRIGRPGIMTTIQFGSMTYSQEELVAEMTSAFLCGHCGIEAPLLENQAAYISSWMEKLKNDHRMIVQAAAQAQKAADWILGPAVELTGHYDQPMHNTQ